MKFSYTMGSTPIKSIAPQLYQLGMHILNLSVPNLVRKGRVCTKQKWRIFRQEGRAVASAILTTAECFLAIKLPFHHHTYVTINKILIVVIFSFIPSSIPANVFVISIDHKLVFYSRNLTSLWVKFQIN